MAENLHSNLEGQDADEERLALRTREDWLAEVRRLEHQRAQIEQAMPDPEVLAYDRDFNFLLGKISMAQRELIAHSVDEVVQEIDTNLQ